MNDWLADIAKDWGPADWAMVLMAAGCAVFLACSGAALIVWACRP